MTRGIKNNNPANIRLSSSHWLGAIKGNDKEFVVFKDMLHGVRALIKLIRTYSYHYGLNSIKTIIYRFAPPSENHTSTYISFVVQNIGVKGIYADTPLDLDFFDFTNTSILFLLCRAICRYESNYDLCHSVFLSSLLMVDPNIKSAYDHHLRYLSGKFDLSF